MSLVGEMLEGGVVDVVGVMGEREEVMMDRVRGVDGQMELDRYRVWRG